MVAEAILSRDERERMGTREAILQAALRLFVTRGYFQTTIDQVAVAALVAKGSIYTHFESKQAIAVELFRLCGERATDGMDEILPDCTTTKQRLRALISHVFEWAQAHHDEAVYLLLVRHSEIFPPPPDDEAYHATPGRLLYDIIQEGVENGEIPMTDVGLACNISGIPILMVRNRLEGWPGDDLMEHLDIATRMCCDALGIKETQDSC